MGLRTWAMSLIRKSEPDRTYRIGISPGHGGEDSGAVGADGSREADLARDFAGKLCFRLRENPMYSPRVYGQDEKKKDYAQRVRDSDANKDMFYIPCHFNAFSDSKKNGWMIIVDPMDAEQNPSLYGLAVSIALELQKFCPLGFADFDNKKDGVMPGGYKPIYELKRPKAYTIYLELGFISNPQYCETLKGPMFMTKMADAVATGMEKYLNLFEFKEV